MVTKLPGKTAGAVIFSGGGSIASIAQYNQQQKKINGQWIDGNTYEAEDLFGIVGKNTAPQLPLTKQLEMFTQNVHNNAMVHEIKLSETEKNYGSRNGTAPNLVITMIQSFDFNANPELRPPEAHQMAEELFNTVGEYAQSNHLPFNFDSALISTHIDKSKIEQGYKKNKDGILRINEPHLHSHIVIPAFDYQGDPFYNFLRPQQKYDIRALNDEILAKHNLYDYHFNKLLEQIDPVIISSKIKQDNLNLAKQRLYQVNISLKPELVAQAFEKTKKLRDSELEQRFGFTKKMVQKTPPQFLFTMDDFEEDPDKKKKEKKPWYNTKQLKTLTWDDPQSAFIQSHLPVDSIKPFKNELVTPSQLKTVLEPIMQAQKYDFKYRKQIKQVLKNAKKQDGNRPYTNFDDNVYINVKAPQLFTVNRFDKEIHSLQELRRQRVRNQQAIAKLNQNKQMQHNQSKRIEIKRNESGVKHDGPERN